MATFDQKIADIKACIDLLEEARDYGANTLIGKVDAVVASLRGREAERAAAAARSYRRGIGGGLIRLGQAIVEPHLRDLAVVIGSDDLSLGDVFWRDLRVYMIANSKSVPTRDITFGSASAGDSNTGNGTVYRLTVDDDGLDIEHMHLATVRLECIRDQSSGVDPGREVFRIHGKASGEDVLEELGNPDSKQIVSLDGSVILPDSSFENFSGTLDTPTDIGQWETDMTAVTDYRFTEGDYYRKSPEERANTDSTDLTGKPRALWLKNTSAKYIQQRFYDLGGIKGDKPIVFGFAFRRDSEISGFTAGAGTLTPSLGNATFAAITVSAQTGWTRAIVTFNKNLFYKNLNNNNLIAKVIWDPSAGHLLLDSFWFGYLEQYNGAWYVIIPGTTDWKKDDTVEFADALTSTDSKWNAWFWRLFDRTLNHDGTPSIPDP